jgi:hypothetical protein
MVKLFSDFNDSIWDELGFLGTGAGLYANRKKIGKAGKFLFKQGKKYLSNNLDDLPNPIKPVTNTKKTFPKTPSSKNNVTLLSEMKPNTPPPPKKQTPFFNTNTSRQPSYLNKKQDLENVTNQIRRSNITPSKQSTTPVINKTPYLSSSVKQGGFFKETATEAAKQRNKVYPSVYTTPKPERPFSPFFNTTQSRQSSYLNKQQDLENATNLIKNSNPIQGNQVKKSVTISPPNPVSNNKTPYLSSSVKQGGFFKETATEAANTRNKVRPQIYSSPEKPKPFSPLFNPSISRKFPESLKSPVGEIYQPNNIKIQTRQSNASRLPPTPPLTPFQSKRLFKSRTKNFRIDEIADHIGINRQEVPAYLSKLTPEKRIQLINDIVAKNPDYSLNPYLIRKFKLD